MLRLAILIGLKHAILSLNFGLLLFVLVVFRLILFKFQFVLNLLVKALERILLQVSTINEVLLGLGYVHRTLRGHVVLAA